VFPALRARSLLIPLRRLVRSPRRTIAVMDLAAGTHVLVMGVEWETQLGYAALHRLLIRSLVIWSGCRVRGARSLPAQLGTLPPLG
jgi:hypothetical protein